MTNLTSNEYLGFDTDELRGVIRERDAEIDRLLGIALDGGCQAPEYHGHLRQTIDRLHAALKAVYKLAGGHATECQCRQCEIFEFLEPIVGNTSVTLSGNSSVPNGGDHQNGYCTHTPSCADVEACRSWLVTRGDSLAGSGDMIRMVDELLKRRRAHETVTFYEAIGRSTWESMPEPAKQVWRDHTVEQHPSEETSVRPIPDDDPRSFSGAACIDAAARAEKASTPHSCQTCGFVHTGVASASARIRNAQC